MTIHFFTFSDEQAGSSRQRAFRVAEELQKHGFSTVLHYPPALLISRTPWPKKFLLILRLIRSLVYIRKGDILFLQRTISNKYFFIILIVYILLFRPKVIFDFDDPVYLHSFLKTKIFTQLADIVFVCDHAQAEWARQYNENVHLFHISLKFEAYKKHTKDYSHSKEPYVIGWVGVGPDHPHNLKLLVPVFERLCAETDIPFKFTLIGALKSKEVYTLFEGIPGLQTEFIDTLDWTEAESTPREIQKFDIGVIPHQSEGEWNRAKTSFKVLEYMACGVATVCSKFGEMPYIIEDAKNGFLVSSTDEWVERLQRLLRDRALCAELGRAGQKRIQEEYTFEVMIPRMAETIRSLMQ